MKNDLPQVGQITSIYVINCGTVLFRAFHYKTSWIPHFRGYALHEEPHVSEWLLHLSELVLCTPYIFVDHKPFLPLSYSLFYLMYIDLVIYITVAMAVISVLMGHAYHPGLLIVHAYKKCIVF